MKIPGLIDVHVHLREPGATHKEDWDTGTAAALAGGITTVLAMPNTQPPIIDPTALAETLTAARRKARCDYGQYLGAGLDNAADLPALASQSAGLKMYLDQTYGPLRLDNLMSWMAHFKHWPVDRPIVAHAEGRTMAAVILLATLQDRAIHLCHVSRRDEILIIKAAKEKGLRVTCEVAPHHLFLTTEDIPALGPGRSEVRPRLAAPTDRDALWENLAVVDCFATDHAPHTLAEKDGPEPPPGYPGLETALPLFLTAVQEGRLTMEEVLVRMVQKPSQIFNLPTQSETFVEIDPDARWEIRAAEAQTRCGWTPFEGRQVHGRVRQVVLRGQEAFLDGQVLVSPGYGLNVRTINV